MKMCRNGHRYDETQYDSCPQCDIENDSKTTAFTSNKQFRSNMTPRQDFRSYNSSDNRYSNISSDESMYSSEGYLDSYVDDSDMHTVGLYKKIKGFDPVVGWLVCIEGASKGKDFIIKAERNFIGHDPSMDICIAGDNTISAKKHAIISFNPKENVFRVGPGDGHGIVYLNNNEVFTAEKLKRNDVIQIGQTSLMFIPFCDENFAW
ncbi:MAG: FHA domain-containing protein [Candidatus Ornithomonoglobus sp.]